MPYSTGRGGAGNIMDSKTATSEHNDASHLQNIKSVKSNSSANSDKKVYYSTGRGGAGNIKSSNERPSPHLVPQGSNTPQLSSEVVTTGRGGFGNMVKNNNKDLTRKLQDVDGVPDRERDTDLYAVASNKSFSVGRGGFGNVISHTKSRNSQASGGQKGEAPVNLMTISSHGAKEAESLGQNKKKTGFMGKIKGMFQ